MKVIVFEDNIDNFYPIVETRPVWDLRYGAFTIKERIMRIAEEKEISTTDIYFFCREELLEIFIEKNETLNIGLPIPEEHEQIIFLNASSKEFKKVLELSINDVLISDNYLHGFSFAYKNEDLKEMINILPQMVVSQYNIKKSQNYFSYLWEIILENSFYIKEDFSNYFNAYSSLDDLTVIGDKNLLFIEDGVRIDPFVCFDCSNGPIIIRKGTVINSMTRIEGPCFVDKNCVLLGTKLREGCSIGECCRLGGEVEESIFQSFSNKYHDGFIGHAYIGEWVNLGALTTNSDLKNNYSTVKTYTPKEYIDSKELKVGCRIGDFTKTSIGTLMNTGACLGVGTMVVHSGRMTPQYLPDFSWFIKNEIRDSVKIEDFLNSTKIMMKRRGQDFTEKYAHYLKNKFLETKENRMKYLEEWNAKL